MLNDLTKQLYSEGWSRDNHPSHVYWSDFENFGFKFEYLIQLAWRTPCGLSVNGRTVSTSDVSYGGTWYCPENGNPVIRCPYSLRDCEHQSSILGKYCMCICSRSDTQYEYEKSVEKVEKEQDRKSHAKYIELTGGQYCVNVVNSNGYQPGEYRIDFSPERCIQYGCTKKKRDLSKVNIFYDVRREWKTRNGFLEDHKVSIEKGVKVFPKPVARTDAELWLTRKKASYNPFMEKYVINPHLTNEDRRQEFFSKHHRQYPGYDYFEFRYSVENIRIEARETRDLLQDLRDVAEGIEVAHASDKQKSEAQLKKEGRQKRAELKRQRNARKRMAECDDGQFDLFTQM